MCRMQNANIPQAISKMSEYASLLFVNSYVFHHYRTMKGHAFHRDTRIFMCILTLP